MSAKLPHFLLLLFAIVLLISLGWIAPQSGERESSSIVGTETIMNPKTNFENASTPITAILQMEPLPLIGESAALTCTVSSVFDAPGTSVQIELPADARVISGDPTWHGDILAGNSITLSISIVFTKGGDKAVYCRALRYVNEDETWGDLAEFYANIGSERSILGYATLSPMERNAPGILAIPGDGQIIEPNTNTPLPDPLPSEEPTPESFLPLDNNPYLGNNNHSEPQVEAAAGSLIVTGRWSYFDRDDNLIGAPFLLIELLKGDDSSHLAWCWADRYGYYTCPSITNPGSVGVRTRMMTYVSFNPYGDVLAVVNPDVGTTADPANTYKVITSAVVFTDGTHDIGSWNLGNGIGNERAFWAEEDIVAAWDYVWWNAGQSQSPQETSGGVTVEWKTSSTDGTYYTHGGNIHLAGEDPVSASVATHEYGHKIMYTVYGDWMPPTACPSPHYVKSAHNDQCAWREGWANFFALVVNNDPVFLWPSGSTLNLETPTWGTSTWDDGDTVEGRVAAALWDMLDTTDDGSDETLGSSDDFANIWDTLFHQNDNNFSEFWAAWKSRGHDELFPVMAIYQNTIDYRSTKPGTFNKLTPANGATGQAASFTLDWGTSTGTGYYQYCYDTSNNNVCNGSWVSTGTTSSATITGLSPTTTYYWQVRAGESGGMTYGNGPGPTTWWSFTTGNVPGAFNKSSPTNGAKKQPGVTLSWGASTNATQYYYCYDTTNDNNCLLWVANGTNTSIALNLTAGTTYYWQAKATNSFGNTYAAYANGSFSTFWSFATDGTVPRVNSIIRSGTNPTNATSVNFTVTFTESVTGVNIGDFNLTTTGVSGATVSGVSGSGSVYTVAVNTGSGNGTIRLNVTDNNSIVDAALNPLGGVSIGDGNFTAGEVYTITKSGGGDTTGVFRPGNGLLYLKNTNATGFADVAINYGTAGDYPVAGDWDGNGTVTIGIYRNGIFYLRNSNTVGFADLVFAFGQTGDQPVAGDWNGDGIDTIGIYRNGLFLLRNSNSAGAADTSFSLGNPGDVGIAGDWNGDGMDTTGVFRPSNGIIFLKNANTSGFADVALNYGLSGDMPVTGDWDNDGIDTIGVYRNAQFLLRNSNTIGFADIVFALGNPGDMPIAGNWDGLP